MSREVIYSVGANMNYDTNVYDLTYGRVRVTGDYPHRVFVINDRMGREVMVDQDAIKALSAAISKLMKEYQIT